MAWHTTVEDDFFWIRDTSGATEGRRGGDKDKETKQFQDIADMNNDSSYALSSTKRRDTERIHDLTLSK